ncbi:MAG: hypothetical protein E7582_02405 [Ruminococcaceae bacterium]|nr:hypothetical protein [Oscillospiraceae bacterium]
MKEICRKYRESAKVQVFSHIGQIFFAVIITGLVSSLISYHFQLTAFNKNIELISGDPEMLKIALIVSALSSIVTLPLTFCLTRFYLLTSRTHIFQKIPIKAYFTPFESPSYLLKCSLLTLTLTVINCLGVFLLIFPVFLSFCMAPFIMSDNPETSVFSALKKSFKMMRGKKMMAFRASFPFLIFYLVITMFFASIPVISFIMTAAGEALFYVTLALIYNDLKNAELHTN